MGSFDSAGALRLQPRLDGFEQPETHRTVVPRRWFNIAAAFSINAKGREAIEATRKPLFVLLMINDLVELLALALWSCGRAGAPSRRWRPRGRARRRTPAQSSGAESASAIARIGPASPATYSCGEIL